MQDYQLYILRDKEALTHRALEQFFSLAESSLIANGHFFVALSGGTTIKELYEQIAAERDRLEDWSKVYMFFGDERYVPHDHEDSNYRMANEALLQHIPRANVYPIPTQPDPQQAAHAYTETLRRVMAHHIENGYPRFDLIWLGIGDDGHTASLFPHTSALKENEALVVANHVEKLESSPSHGDRLTFTFPVLNNAANATVLVSGESKAPALREVLHGEPDPEKYPAQRIKLTDGSLVWLVDDAAAGALPDNGKN